MPNRLKELRKSRHLTQKAVAGYLSMSQTGYSKYELHDKNIPTRILRALSVFYKTSVDYLLGLTDEEAPYKRRSEIR